MIIFCFLKGKNGFNYFLLHLGEVVCRHETSIINKVIELKFVFNYF